MTFTSKEQIKGESVMLIYCVRTEVKFDLEKKYTSKRNKVMGYVLCSLRRSITYKIQLSIMYTCVHINKLVS